MFCCTPEAGGSTGVLSFCEAISVPEILVRGDVEDVVTDDVGALRKTANLRESTQIASLCTRAWPRLNRGARAARLGRF